MEIVSNMTFCQSPFTYVLDFWFFHKEDTLEFVFKLDFEDLWYTEELLHFIWKSIWVKIYIFWPNLDELIT